MNDTDQHKLMYIALEKIASKWDVCIDIASVGENDSYYGFEACKTAMVVLNKLGKLNHDCSTCCHKLNSRKIAPCIDCSEFELWEL